MTTAILQGVLRSYEGDDRGEEEAYLAALAQAPRYQYLNQVLVTMSAELMRQGRLNAAEHIARQIARINPRNYEAATNLGASLRLQRRYAQAAEVLRQAVVLNREYTLAHLNLGLAYVGSSDHAKALEVFRRVLELDPRNPLATEMVVQLDGVK